MTTEFNDKLEVKGNKTLLLTSTVFFLSSLLYLLLGPYDKTRVIFERNFIVATALTLVFVISLVFLIVKITNNKPLIIITDIGVLTRENEIIEWNKILSIEAQRHYSENLITSIINLTIKERETELKIDTTFFKPDLNTIMEFMKKVNTNHDIIFTTNDK